jgi:hypothetical protein
MKLFLRGAAIVLGMSVIAVLSFLTTAHGQGSILGGIVTYNPQNDWVLFTDNTGTWHAPLAMTNSAAPSDSVVEFTVNTDDQFVIQTYGGGNPTSLLDVDVDGSAALYGSAGGGIGVDANTGDTCIPSTRPSPCSPTSLRVASSGVLTQYMGQPTAGNGMPTILYYADTSLSGSFGPYTIFTTSASGYGSSGLYRLTGYMTVTTASNGSTMQFQASYYDESGLQSQTSGAPIPFQSVGEKLPFSFVIYSQANSPISISMVTLGGNPTYTVHLRLEAL